MTLPFIPSDFFNVFQNKFIRLNIRHFDLNSKLIIRCELEYHPSINVCYIAEFSLFNACLIQLLHRVNEKNPAIIQNFEPR